MNKSKIKRLIEARREFDFPKKNINLFIDNLIEEELIASKVLIPSNSLLYSEINTDGELEHKVHIYCILENVLGINFLYESIKKSKIEFNRIHEVKKLLKKLYRERDILYNLVIKNEKLPFGIGSYEEKNLSSGKIITYKKPIIFVTNYEKGEFDNVERVKFHNSRIFFPLISKIRKNL